MISDRINTVYDLIQRSYDLADHGKSSESNDVYGKAFIIAENLIKNNDIAMFSDDELDFLKKIITTFNYE
jgi:hypothetical protein